MPTAGTVVERLFRILGKVVKLLVLTIYQLLMRLFNANFGKDSDQDDAGRGLRPVTKTKLTPNLCLREVKDVDLDSEDTPKPLVLFFPWLMASKKLVNIYADLYHQRGWDVLTVQGQMKHFLWPPKAIAVAQEVVTYLKHNEAQLKRPLVVHAMSIGAYMYTILIMELQKTPKTLEKMSGRVQGQVFDSIVIGGFDRMGTGIAKSYASTAFVQFLITTSVQVYLKMTRQYTMEFYNLAVSTFYDNPVRSPALIFYSHDDPMTDPKAVEDVVVQWTSTRDDDVVTKCWVSSPHAKHLRAHREEYLETFESFMKKIVPCSHEERIRTGKSQL